MQKSPFPGRVIGRRVPSPCLRGPLHPACYCLLLTRVRDISGRLRRLYFGDGPLSVQVSIKMSFFVCLCHFVGHGKGRVFRVRIYCYSLSACRSRRALHSRAFESSAVWWYMRGSFSRFTISAAFAWFKDSQVFPKCSKIIFMDRVIAFCWYKMYVKGVVLYW